MKRFKSKLSMGIFLFPNIGLLAVAILLIVEKAWLGLPIILVIALFLNDIYRNTYYSIEDGVLTIDAGRFYLLQIPISNIYKIKPSRDPSKAPANSMDRLSIRYTKDCKKKEVLVSPENKEAFMQALKEINEDIELGRLYKI